MEQGQMYQVDELYIYAEETRGGDLRLLRCYGSVPQAELPGVVDGHMVTAIGDYCFAESPKAHQSCHTLPDGVRELAGEYLQSVIIPDSVTSLGSLAFYNCSNLEEIFFGANLEKVGSDVFMNCPKLRIWNIRSLMEERTGLKQLLAQRMSETTVLFRQGEETAGEIFFPEYYEYHDEIGPAHIFALSIHGEGFRARQCFQDGIFSARSYDEIFEQACAQEDDVTLCKMAFGRVYFPISLGREAQEIYTAYLKEHEKLLAKILVEGREKDRLLYAVQNGILSETGLQYAVRLAAGKEWPEGAAVLLSAGQEAHSEAGDRYSFDEF